MKLHKILLGIVCVASLTIIGVNIFSVRNKEEIVIYSPLEDYRAAELETQLSFRFPNKKIIIQYIIYKTLNFLASLVKLTKQCIHIVLESRLPYWLFMLL
jgi:hypothetical protein